MEEQNKIVKNDRNTKGLWILIAILAVVVIGVLIWGVGALDQAHKEKVERIKERTELQAQLDSLMAVHNKIKAEYGQLSDSLAVKDSIIQAKAAEIKKMMNYRWQYYIVKKKLAALQKIAQGYVRQMDSLYTENHKLTAENHQIKEVLQQEKQKNAQLLNEKQKLSQKVEKASILHTYNFKVEAVHVTGAGRERKTDKIRRVSKIKVCFTVASNEVAKPGIRTIYVRIARPDKKILVINDSEEYSFMFNGKRLQYSIKKEINYQNQSMDVCMSWPRRSTQKLLPGLYHVDVFEGNYTIGQATFTLR